MTDWAPVSYFWPAQPTEDRLHVFVRIRDAGEQRLCSFEQAFLSWFQILCPNPHPLPPLPLITHTFDGFHVLPFVYLLAF
jgi:hypothetical protein